MRGWASTLYEFGFSDRKRTAYDSSGFLVRDMVSLSSKGSLDYPGLKLSINPREQETMFRIMFGQGSHKDIKGVVDEQRGAAIFNF